MLLSAYFVFEQKSWRETKWVRPSGEKFVLGENSKMAIYNKNVILERLRKLA